MSLDMNFDKDYWKEEGQTPMYNRLKDDATPLIGFVWGQQL